MKLILAILIILAIIWSVTMLTEKKKIREFIRWYQENITIYDMFYPVLAKAIEQKADCFDSSSIKLIENVEIEPMIIQVDRTLLMLWKKTQVRGVVYELERMFNELADYSEKISDTIKGFEELKANQDDIYIKLYHIRLLRLNLPQS